MKEKTKKVCLFRATPFALLTLILMLLYATGALKCAFWITLLPIIIYFGAVLSWVVLTVLLILLYIVLMLIITWFF